MLVLSRRKNECIVIGGHIVITTIDIRGDKVRLGIDAPQDFSIHRQEVHEAIDQKDEAVAHDSGADQCDGAPSDGDIETTSSPIAR